MKTKYLAFALWTAAIIISTGCRHRELCTEHPPKPVPCQADLTADYQLEWEFPYENLTNWPKNFPTNIGLTYDGLKPVVPEGLRVMAYSPNLDFDGSRDEQDNIRETNLPPHGGIVWMAEGKNSLLFYNNDTEYIKFEGMSSFGTAVATTRGRGRQTYTGNPYYKAPESRGEETVNPPDMLFGTYIPQYTAVVQPEPAKLHVTLHPVVYTYVIDYEIKQGAEYVRLGRGALAGMARGVRLDNGHSTPEAVTVLFDANLIGNHVVATVKTFGVPDFPNPDYVSRAGEGLYALNLEVRLADGSLQDFDFDVTNQVAKQPRGGVIFVTVDKIELKDEDNGSFDVDLEGWGEYIDVPIVF